MKIARIEVDNFRILKELKLDLQDDLSLILGKNNCGKTTLLTMLDRFIGSGTSMHPFLWDDFSLEFKSRFYKLATKNKLTKNDLEFFPCGIKLTLFIEYTEDDDLSNISAVMMDLEPDNNTIVLEFAYTISTIKIDELRSNFSELCIKAMTKKKKSKKEELFSKFMNEESKKYFVNKKFTRKYDQEKKIATDIRAIIENDKIIKKIICFKSINARRTVSNSDSERSLSKLSSDYYEHTKEDDDRKNKIEKFKETIGETDASLTAVYGSLFENVINKVEKFGGIKPGDSKIAITSTLQHRELLKGNTTVVYDHGNSSLLPENFNGLGYLNLIGMIFEIEVIMASLRKDLWENEKPADINLLFIEEPEAHTHPQMQYVFIKNIKDILKENCVLKEKKVEINLQTLISTHSSHIVSECDFEDIKYFTVDRNSYTQAKNMSDLEVKYKNDIPDENIDGELQFKFLKQYLTMNRSELFFADKAIFIEGDTERILLPAMMKKIDEEHLDKDISPLLSQNISIIEVGAYSHIFSRFIDFIGVKSLIITDIDLAKKTTIKKDDGTLKTNKDGTFKMSIIGCNIDETPTTITNNALKFFYSSLFTPSKNKFETLSSLTLDKKILVKDANNDKHNWTVDPIGKLMVSYQTNEVNARSILYQASSFEDSFIHLNRQFIIDNKDVFSSVIKWKRIEAEDTQPYTIADECIAKKTKFATEILLASNIEGNNYSSWSTPQYIEEALLWLRKS
ncbi:ATP-dependent nuclease [Carnobacterium maltaromaticum]|uniref:ATP-dependent nuclease n=1 Tax=Carnobacterium maltaromaticum TaxID=2751 RepID=UPI00295E754E|nr:AAA family ATPase [Carnobacterium maltaromaticum]